MSRLAVVGLGLIGGSLALALGARGFGRDPAVRRRARERGIDVAESLEDAVRGADVVVAAVPTDANADVLRGALAAAPRAVLTDVASLKRPLSKLAEELPRSARVVGGHPMAGSTGQGIDAADARLFDGRTWLLVPTARSDAAAMAAVGDIARAAGARPLVVSAEVHDELMTWASHLPLALAAALARTATREAGPGLARVAGPGFLDTTRLAGTPEALAAELLHADPTALAAALERMRSALDELTRALGDDAALGALLDEARAARAQLEAASDDSTVK